ncbi:alpha/beta hydrolase [Rubinisphaera margarita]|uniref:alpha/beta hydrolase n=1 Tax=Rubinisphaera margarita TaxID=2909586 RepID=UPI001EE8CF79|nr:alpha/beta fold hydrolase [Rubinisphaera margarita]MCG6157363.1 alpha/beta fold hydrolase [Rubinisphaera margarita]
MRSRIPLLALTVLISVPFFHGCQQFDESGETMSLAPSRDRKSKSYDIVRVFYGTNRTATGDSRWNRYYGNEPGELEYGVCEVSIPRSHRYGEIERPSIWRLEFEESADKHILLQNIEPRSEADFVTELQHDVGRSPLREAFVFIHGYNVTFAQASYRAAQMAHDLRFSGPPILYSWPSRGELSGYVADLSAADGSTQHLKTFLERVARDSGADRIHLIAHSMGNRVTTEVLSKLADEGAWNRIPRFNQIILAAPDVDASTFKQEIAPRIVQGGERVTIYASAHDRALQASRLVHRSCRLGQGGENLTTFPELSMIEMVDATGVDFSFFELGHAEYGDALLSDVKLALRGYQAEQRGLEPLPVGAAWRVPPANRRPKPESEPGIVVVAKMETPAEEPEVVTPTGFWSYLKSLWPFQ